LKVNDFQMEACHSQTEFRRQDREKRLENGMRIGFLVRTGG